MPLVIKKIITLFSIIILFSLNVTNMDASAARKKSPLIIVLPAPFNVSENYSSDTSSLYKWTSVLLRMSEQTKTPRPWSKNKTYLEHLDFDEMVKKVNDLINRYPYVTDKTLYGKSDYWATPTEFFLHGGDCEDFALAKYAWLRFLGVPDEKMRIAIVHDRIKNIPHAVLIVYINNKAMILDSQIKNIRASNVTSRYRPIYSINSLGWWVPQKQENFTLGMARGMNNLELINA